MKAPDYWTDYCMPVPKIHMTVWHFSLIAKDKKILHWLSLTYSPEDSKSLSNLRHLKDQHKILLKWAEHFDALLNQHATADRPVLKELPECPLIHSLNQPPTYTQLFAHSKVINHLALAIPGIHLDVILYVESILRENKANCNLP